MADMALDLSAAGKTWRLGGNHRVSGLVQRKVDGTFVVYAGCVPYILDNAAALKADTAGLPEDAGQYAQE